MEAHLFFTAEDDGWRCRKHPSAQPPTGGVCPACLRARLLRLCPECAGERPCGCSSCPSTASSSSLSSLDLHRSCAAGSYVGAVGRVSHLIDSEPAFRRSRSAAFRLLCPRPHDSVDAAPHPEVGRGRLWLWPFARAKKPDDEATRDAAPPPPVTAAAVRLLRSRSVGVAPGSFPDPGAVHGTVGGPGDGDVRLKGWNRYFPSPMKAFRHRKPSKVVQARSPLCRG